MLTNLVAGLGDAGSRFKVYIANRPDFADLRTLDSIRAMRPGEIREIGKHCGNGWRKVFNVYAKLVFALRLPFHHIEQYPTWQNWRDNCLLAQGSNSLLLFSPPELTSNAEGIHIVMGKQYAKKCFNVAALTWLNNEFAVHETSDLIVCPYFDYRQLSNQKIMFLCDLIKTRRLQNSESL